LTAAVRAPPIIVDGVIGIYSLGSVYALELDSTPTLDDPLPLQSSEIKSPPGAQHGATNWLSAVPREVPAQN
jgi:hypothetical protein